MMNEKMRWITPIREKILSSCDHTETKAYFVGGIVRDAIIGRDNKDIDICVVGHPTPKIARRLVSSLPDDVRKEITNDLKRSGGGTDLVKFLSESGGAIALSIDLFLSGMGSKPVVYTRFLTAMSTIDGLQVEFTGARHDIYEKREGRNSRQRNPSSVKSADERSDARRRDFTINALFVDLEDLSLLDPTGMGLNDIENGIIRTTRPEEPHIVFGDDPLRILRAIRFSAQLGFSIEENTRSCIERMTREKGDEFFSRNGFVSMERTRDELCKMLLSDRPEMALTMMSDIGMLGIVIPELQALREIKNIGHKDIWHHTLIVMRNATEIPDDLIAACEEVEEGSFQMIKLRIMLSTMLHDIGKIQTRDYGTSTCGACGLDIEMKDEPFRECECGEIVEFDRDSVTFHDHHKISSKMAKEILYRMKFERQMAEWVGEDCFLHTLDERFMGDGTFSTSTEKRSPMLPIERLINKLSASRGEYDPKWGRVNELVRWHIIYSDASGKSRTIRNVVSDLRSMASEVQELRAEEAERIRANKPIIDGSELQEIFGMGPGKWIGEIHQRMREDRLENPDIHDRDRAMEISRSVVRELFGR